MTVHEKTYREFFDLAPDDYIFSEISSQLASEIHHLYPKSMGGRKTFTHNGKKYPIECIENYIALTREEHELAHANHFTKEQLWDIHKEKMKVWRVN